MNATSEPLMFSLLDILDRLSIPFTPIGPVPPSVARIAPLDDADEASLIFVARPSEETIAVLRRSSAAVALVDAAWGRAHVGELAALGRSVLLVDQPRLIVGRILREAFPPDELWGSGIHPSAIVHPDARIHPSVSVGPFAIVGRCTIGEDSRMGPFAVIKDGVEVGSRVSIRDHCVIGGVGFGFARDQSARLERIPHVGGVVIDDDVDLFPYVNVDRATLGNTRVRRGTKIDHYAHIGHNSSVGEDCVITAQVVLCGRSSVGDRAWLGVGAVVREGVRVGSDATVGLGSVVLKDVADGATVAGVPARSLR